MIEIWTLQLMWLEKWLSYRSPEILALVPRVHFVFEGGRRYRVVQSLYDLVVDCPRLPESVLRFKYIFKLTTKGGISLQDVPGSFSTTPLTPFSSTYDFEVYFRLSSVITSNCRKSSHCMRPFGDVDPAENVEPDPTLALIGKDSFDVILILLCAVF